MNDVKGYNRLSPDTKDMFLRIYRKHLSGMGKEEREKHTIDKMISIKINQDENCFEVYYQHDWYKYYPNGTWG